MAQIERKLTTIMAADVAGYSAMMERDEEGTMQTLRGHRATMRGFIERHRGRIANTAGDSVMAEFPSVLEAVTAAAEIQQELGARNAALPPEQQMQFRIGINLGDVMVEGEDLFGEGVNIAARLEGLAEPGGIVISGTVYEQVKNKLTLEYDFMGSRHGKNMSDEIPVYRVETGPPPTQPVAEDTAEPPDESDAPTGLADTLGSLGEKIGKIIDERVDDDEMKDRLAQRFEGRDIGDVIERKVEDLRKKEPGVYVGLPVVEVKRVPKRMVANLAVIIGVLAAFDAMDPSADLAAPLGAFDFSDVVAFLSAFGAGCP